MQGVKQLEVAVRPRATAFAVPRALVRAHWPGLLAAAITVFLGIPTLNYVYGPDQALFAYIGGRIIRGEGLYVDVWDVKPPGIFLIYGVLDLLPGPQVRVLRAADLLYSATTVFAIYALAATYWGRLAGAVAGAFYGVVYVVATGYWHSAQPDSFMVLPLILALLAYEYARRRGSAELAVCSGLLFGFAAQLRPVVLLVPAVLLLVDVWSSTAGASRLGRRLRSEAMRRALTVVVGAAAVELVVLLWLAVHGAVGEYFYAQLEFASEYARRGGPYSPDGVTLTNYLSGLRSGTMFIVFARLLLVAPALTAVVAGGLVRRERLVLQTAWLTLAAYIGVAMQGKFFLYHWHLLLPFLAVLGGWTGSFLWRSLRAAGRGPALAGGTLAAFGTFLLLLTPNVTDRAAREWSGFVRYFTEPERRSAYYDRFGLYGRSSFSYRASDEVSAYLRARTAPGDTIFVWGYDPLLYVSTGRDSPSRFTSFLPLMSEWAPRAWVDEWLDDLEARRPVYIITQRNENAPWITGHWIDPNDYIKLLPRFQALLERDYEVERGIEDYLLYRRRS